MHVKYPSQLLSPSDIYSDVGGIIVYLCIYLFCFCQKSDVSSAGRNGMLAAPVGKGRVGDDNKCVMCEFALHFLQNMLEQKDTRVSILMIGLLFFVYFFHFFTFCLLISFALLSFVVLFPLS